MKRISQIGFLLLTMLPGMAEAQLSIGLKGGANLSTIEFVTNPDFKFKEPKYKNGIQGGLVIQYSGNPHVGVQMEINYTQHGWTEKPRPKEDQANVENLKYEDRRINYVEVPLLTHASIGAGNFRVIVDMGPYASYALDASYVIKDYQDNEIDYGNYQFEKERDNRFDYGLQAGAGFEYEFPVGNFYAEARYVYGFGNIYKTVVDESEISQNRVIGITIGFNFVLGKKAKNAKPKTVQP